MTRAHQAPGDPPVTPTLPNCNAWALIWEQLPGQSGSTETRNEALGQAENCAP